MNELIDLKNKKFGKLTVIGFNSKNKKHIPFWNCKCECGNEVIINGYNLKNGHTKSCGCIQVVNTIKITYNGKTQTILKWSIDLEINKMTLIKRLKRGWSIEKSLNTPLRKYSYVKKEVFA